MGKITPNSAIVVIKQEEKGVIEHLQSNLRLWYRIVLGAHQDINIDFIFPIYLCPVQAKF